MMIYAAGTALFGSQLGVHKMILELIKMAVDMGKFVYTSVSSSSENDQFLTAIEKSKNEVVNAIEQAKNQIISAILAQNYHNAFHLAYAALDSVNDWSTFSIKQRIGEAAPKYWLAENESQLAVSALQTDENGRHINPNVMTLEQATLMACVVNIRLNVLTYGSQVFDSQKIALMNDINQYSVYMETALNNLSEQFEKGPKEDCPPRKYHIEIDPDTGAKIKIYEEYDERKKRCRKRENGAKLLMSIVQEWKSQ